MQRRCWGSWLMFSSDGGASKHTLQLESLECRAYGQLSLVYELWHHGPSSCQQTCWPLGLDAREPALLLRSTLGKTIVHFHNCGSPTWVISPCPFCDLPGVSWPMGQSLGPHRGQPLSPGGGHIESVLQELFTHGSPSTRLWEGLGSPQ